MSSQPLNFFLAPVLIMNETNMLNSQNLGIGGAIVLFIGCFLPFISVPILGDITFFGNGEIQGFFVIVFAVASIAFVLFGKNEGLFLTSIPVLSILIAVPIYLNRVLSNASESSNPLVKDIAIAAAKTVQIQWGWAIMFVGACLLFASAMMFCLTEFKSQSLDSVRRQILFYKYGSIFIMAILLTGIIFYSLKEKML
jgi:hypothetical protein